MENLRAGAAALLILSTLGCVGPDTFTEQVTYEVQVRDLLGKPVPGAKVTAAAHTREGPPVEALTDSRGRCSLVFRQSSLLVPRPTSEARYRWLSVTVEAAGFGPLALEYHRSQFIDDGGDLRRAEAVLLHPKPSGGGK